MASAVQTRPLRIGDVAKEVGTTTRTIRYYEEIGLLRGTAERRAGGHRVYTRADVDRLREILRLRDLLGVSLDELKELVAAEDARASLRAEWRSSDPGPERRRQILNEALGHIARQLELVRARRADLDRLEGELASRRRSLRSRLRELDGG